MDFTVFSRDHELLGDVAIGGGPVATRQKHILLAVGEGVYTLGLLEVAPASQVG